MSLKTEELVSFDQVKELARDMWRGEPVPGRVYRFAGALLGLVDNALESRSSSLILEREEAGGETSDSSHLAVPTNGPESHAEAGFALPPKISAIIECLHTQDNRITSHPLFAVQQKRVIYGLDEDYADALSWVDEDGEVTDPEVIAQLESGDLSRGARRVGYIEKWEFVTGCMTEQGCKDFIACNGHNLNEPRIYAYSAFRNAEFIALREWLMGLQPMQDSPLSGARPTSKKDEGLGTGSGDRGREE